MAEQTEYSANDTIRLDLWTEIIDVHWKDDKSKSITVIANISGVGLGGVGGGIELAQAGPVKIGTAISDTGGPGQIGGLSAEGSLDPEFDLSKFFTKREDESTHEIVYVSYQTIIDEIIAAHGGGSIIRGIPVGHDADGNNVVGGGDPPYFQSIVIMGHSAPSRADLFQSAIAITVDKEHQGFVGFSIHHKGPTEVALQTTVQIDAYDDEKNKVGLDVNREAGTIKAVSVDENGFPITPVAKWSFTMSQPSASSGGPTDINLAIKLSGVS